MILLNPKTEKYEHLDEKSREIMFKTIEFFEQKGKIKVIDDYNARVWYSDFLDFIKENKIFAGLLTPTGYGDEDSRWDTRRNCDFNEILGFYGLVYWYTWQVTILGLGPIWMGDNEEVKHKTAQLLKDGGIFAFGLSDADIREAMDRIETFLYKCVGGLACFFGQAVNVLCGWDCIGGVYKQE